MVESELDAIPRAKLKEKLRALERKPTSGKPLTGELKGCRRLRVDENRIVYRMYEEGEDTICEVVAIGRRRDDAVYGEVAKRIGDA